MTDEKIMIKQFINKNIVKIVAGVDLEKELSTLLSESREEAVREFGNKIINVFKSGKMGTKYSTDDDLAEKVLQISAPQIVKGVLDDFLAEGKI